MSKTDRARAGLVSHRRCNLSNIPLSHALRSTPYTSVRLSLTRYTTATNPLGRDCRRPLSWRERMSSRFLSNVPRTRPRPALNYYVRQSSGARARASASASTTGMTRGDTKDNEIERERNNAAGAAGTGTEASLPSGRHPRRLICMSLNHVADLRSCEKKNGRRISISHFYEQCLV